MVGSGLGDCSVLGHAVRSDPLSNTDGIGLGLNASYSPPCDSVCVCVSLNDKVKMA